jgi:hypothetical protein
VAKNSQPTVPFFLRDVEFEPIILEAMWTPKHCRVGPPTALAVVPSTRRLSAKQPGWQISMPKKVMHSFVVGLKGNFHTKNSENILLNHRFAIN